MGVSAQGWVHCCVHSHVEMLDIVFKVDNAQSNAFVHETVSSA